MLLRTRYAVNIFVLGIIVFSWGMPIWAESSTYILDSANSTVNFLGRSTLHKFSGTANGVSGTVQMDKDNAHFNINGDVIIPVDKMDTENLGRDKKMREMFESDRYPNIKFSVNNMVPQSLNSNLEGVYQLDGKLKIRDIEQDIRINASVSILSDSIEVSGEVPLTTTMFSLKPPSVLGLIRVNKNVLVKFNSRWIEHP